MASVAIIDYGSSNLRSVEKAFEHVTDKVKVVSKASELEAASHIVLPGVGAFADCVAGLSSIPDMVEILHRQVIENKKWFLGVCVGMQMLFEKGHEHGIHKGLGWFAGEVIPISQATANGKKLKIPHMGWNSLQIDVDSPLFNGIKSGDHAYFVHSYYAKPENAEIILANTDYGQKITAVVGKDNIFGTQFHPEKSQKLGLKIVENFVGL